MIKRTWAAFARTDRQALKERRVTLAIDPETDLRPAAHDALIASMSPRPGATGSTPEILDLLTAGQEA